MPDQTQPVAATPAPKPISCGQIARRLKRNRVSIYRHRTLGMQARARSERLQLLFRNRL